MECLVFRTHEATLSVSSAASHIEQQTGHRPNPATLWRWMHQGKLYSFYVGRRRLTTRAAVDELLAAFNAAKHEPLAAAAPRADVQQAGADAAERIARMGG